MSLCKTSVRLFLLFVRLLSLLFFFVSLGFKVSVPTFPHRGWWGIKLEVFFFVLLSCNVTRLFYKNCTESINRILRTTGRKVDFGGENTTTTTFRAPQKGRRDGLAFFFDSKSKNKNTFCLLRSQSSLFSIIIIIIIIVRRRGRKEEQRCRLVGKN